MQVKYIVYYPGRNKPPRVALWLTSDGSMIHSKYAEEHNIRPQSYSSLGYVYYSPLMKKYKLEHYSCQEADNLLDFIQRKKEEVRDRRLVLEALQKNPLFKEPHIMNGTAKDWLMFQKRKERNNYTAC